jgi:hypothetical protein
LASVLITVFIPGAGPPPQIIAIDFLMLFLKILKL